MPDRFGRPIRCGDTIAYASPAYGMVVGVMKYDENEKAKYHVNISYKAGRTETKYFQRYVGNDASVINLTSVLDQGLTGLI